MLPPLMPSGRKHVAPSRRRPWLEALESRYAPACAVGSGTPEVRIDCGAADDTVMIRYDAANADVDVTATGMQARTFTCAALESLTVNAGDGANTVLLDEMCPNDEVTVTSGSGVDQLTVISATECPNWTLSFDLGAGADSALYIVRPPQGRDTEYDLLLAAQELRCANLRVLQFRNVEEMEVRSESNTGESVDFTIDSHYTTATPVPCDVVGDCRPNQIRFTGGVGRETLRFRNFPVGPLTSVHSRFDLTQTTLAHRRLTTGPGPLLTLVTYTNLEGLEVSSGVTNDVFNVQSTLSRTPMTLHGGAGNDVFNVGSLGDRLDSLLGGLTLDGQAGTDTLRVNDQGNSLPHSCTVTALDVEHQAAARISYGGVETLVVSMGAGTNRITVASTAAGTPTTVHAGAGNDTITVGTSANSLSWIQGPLAVNGQGGTDRLHLTDQAALNAHSYWTTAGEILRDGAQPIDYSTVEDLVLTATNQSDALTVLGIPSGTRLAADGGAGLDSLIGAAGANTFAVTSANAGTLNTLTGFASFENLFGQDSADGFLFSSGASVTGYLVGGAGVNTLSYTAYTTGVVVNFSLFSATGVGVFVWQIQNALGGDGNDLLVGDNASNRLDGGAGRDLLIGGGNDYASFRPDVLRGGFDEDILIGGWTLYDYDPAALAALLSEWTRPTAGDYYTRVVNLYLGVGVPVLNPTTVFANRATGGNTLQGGAGLDLFFGVLSVDGGDWDGLAELFIPVF